jgi:ADP-ribosyl-[dinitrogen reductase] hydrolase
MNDLEDRYLGALFGCAIGDALGTTLENQRTPKELLQDIVGGGPFQLLPGCWTDGTDFHFLF